MVGVMKESIEDKCLRIAHVGSRGFDPHYIDTALNEAAEYIRDLEDEFKAWIEINENR